MVIVNTIGNSGCPCGEYKDKDTKIFTHCWRTGYKDCKCPFAGIHYKGSKETAEKIAEDMRENYGCDVAIKRMN